MKKNRLEFFLEISGNKYFGSIDCTSHFFNAFIEIFKDFCFFVILYVDDYFCQAKDTESRADREHGICLYSKLKPRLLKAVPVKGSVASVFTLKMKGLE